MPHDFFEEIDFARDFVRLKRKLASILTQLEDMGVNDMGHLSQRQAGKFHTITYKLRKLVDELMREVKAQ